jgi:Protein of unknown function (DUF2911)
MLIAKKRRDFMKKLTVVLVILLFASLSFAQKKPPLSPPASATCKFADGHSIKVDYSSPRAKGRKIYGGLVPYGEVWRTGANEATTFVTDAPVEIDGKEIPAGNYTMFTVPNPEKWTLIINKKTGEWGIPYKYESDELARVDMSVSKTAAPVEDFTISFHEMGTGCHMYLDWENTRATVKIDEKK